MNMQIRSVAAFAAAAIALAGCSSGHKTTIVTGNGTATLDTSADNKTSTITTKEGTVKVGLDAVDPAKLGLPLYPGATTEGGGGLSMQSKEGGGQMVTMTTTDSFDKVESWYKSKLPAGAESMHFASGDTASAMFALGKETDKDRGSIMINGAKGKTTILLSREVKTGP
jgi:hypothetical protein